MNRDALTPLQLNAFVDGELDTLAHADVEARLAQDEALRSRVDALRGVREAVRAQADYHAAPAAFRARLASRSNVETQRPRWLPASWRSGSRITQSGTRALITGTAIAALFAWAMTATLLHPSHDDLLAQEAVASHVRATLANRLIDVASSDQHSVKPWLSSKLDFAPPVKDMGPTGATLLGARVDYIDGHPAAAVVYRQRQHVINLFIWPTGESDTPLRTSTLRGFNVVHEVNRGMAYWAVSDVNREDLGALVARQSSDAADR